MARFPFLSTSATRIYPSSSMGSASSHSENNDHQQFSDRSAQSATIATNNLHRRIRLLSLIRLALTILAIGAALAVIGCEAHGLSVYNDTRLDGTWGISPLWPIGLDISTSQAKLVAACVVTLTLLLCVAAGVVPVPQRFNLLIIASSTGLSFIGLVGAIFGVAYASHNNRDGDDIQSWTCRWTAGATEVNKMFPDGLAGITAPKDFTRVCVETQVGFGVLAALIGLQTAIVVTTAASAWMEIKMKKSEREFVFIEKGMVDRKF